MLITLVVFLLGISRASTGAGIASALVLVGVAFILVIRRQNSRKIKKMVDISSTDAQGDAKILKPS